MTDSVSYNAAMPSTNSVYFKFVNGIPILTVNEITSSKQSLTLNIKDRFIMGSTL